MGGGEVVGGGGGGGSGSAALSFIGEEEASGCEMTGDCGGDAIGGGGSDVPQTPPPLAPLDIAGDGGFGGLRGGGVWGAGDT